MTRTAFLWHWMTAVALLWCFCQYYSIKQKKARQRDNANEQKRIIHVAIISRQS